jgi:probable phosphoglycerate mutase
MTAAQARILRQIERIREQFPGTGVVLVSHGDVIKAALSHVLGLSLDAYQRFDIGPASISVLALWPGGAKIVGMNEVLAA